MPLFAVISAGMTAGELMAGLSQTHFALLSWLFAADSRLANDEQPPCPD
jgi:hypothetical protein